MNNWNNYCGLSLKNTTRSGADLEEWYEVACATLR